LPVDFAAVDFAAVDAAGAAFFGVAFAMRVVLSCPEGVRTVCRAVADSTGAAGTTVDPVTAAARMRSSNESTRSVRDPRCGSACAARLTAHRLTCGLHTELVREERHQRPVRPAALRWSGDLTFSAPP
jgi:hypothetical protein